MAYILIVDDDEDFARCVARVLSDAGYEVAIETEIDCALHSMTARQPDLAILDVIFPESSSAGFELARTMRHHNERLRGIPIIFLTAVNGQFPLGFGQFDLDEELLPAEDFLEKPLDLDVLPAKVSELLVGPGRPAGPRAANARDEGRRW
jgi:CheY-like chemotaxis protein